MIKKIQLRGISREPSDRMNSDGGVAESINTYINDGESVPMLPPKDVTEELGLPSQEDEVVGQWIMRSRAVYIHRVGTKDNFIYIKKAKPRTGQYGVSYDYLYSYPDGQEIWHCGMGESIIDATVTSIGNTLIFATNKRNGYALYKDGSYTYLGSEIPKPVISCVPFIKKDGTGIDTSFIIKGEEKIDTNVTHLHNFYKLDTALWQAEIDKADMMHSTEYTSLVDSFWGNVQKYIYAGPAFRYPVFVRFALRLYDGSYIYHTVPCLMGGHILRDLEVYLFTSSYTKANGSASGDPVYTVNAHIKSLANPYTISVSVKNTADYAGWKDVVSGIDVFISTPMIYPQVGSNIVQIGEREYSETGYNGYYKLPVVFHASDGSTEESEYLAKMLDDGASNFYKIHSFKVGNLAEDFYTEIENTKDIALAENLVTKDRLPGDFRSNHTYIPERNFTINSRLLSIGMSEIFDNGMKRMYGVIPNMSWGNTASPVIKTYDIYYVIEDNDGSVKCVDATLDTERIAASRTQWCSSDLAQLLYYPDTRCTKAYIIESGTTNGVQVKMIPHPHLDCAYWMGEYGKTISQMTMLEQIPPTVDNVGSSYKYSYLFQSAIENPFYYPAAGRIKFSANIISVAAISAALSEGQYGQFDLYAFTDTGIWVLTPNDEGEFLRLNPLSRDVLLSPSAIVCIDQAVVFVTAKGVMLLSGAKISCISPNMIGRHYSMEQGAIDILSSHGFSGYETQLADSAPFMDFMQKVQIAYDYAGQRLIFFNTSKDYQYVYMLPTGTWHKSVLSARVLEATVLNSYPNCYLFYKGDSAGLHMLNWSTILDVADDTTVVRSVIATRAINLGEPDVFKTINHLRIRGQYERYASYVYLACDSDASPVDIEDNFREVTGNTPLTEDNIHHLATGGRYNVDEPFADGTTWRDRITEINDSLVAIGYAYLHLEVINEPRVSYILQGSNDGINYYVLHSLRGRSWKNYRIIVASRLKPTERISYVEIDYEMRKTNKIR